MCVRLAGSLLKAKRVCPSFQVDCPRQICASRWTIYVHTILWYFIARPNFLTRPYQLQNGPSTTWMTYMERHVLHQSCRLGERSKFRSRGDWLLYQPIVTWWFGSRWFGILGLPMSNNPFHPRKNKLIKPNHRGYPLEFRFTSGADHRSDVRWLGWMGVMCGFWLVERWLRRQEKHVMKRWSGCNYKNHDRDRESRSHYNKKKTKRTILWIRTRRRTTAAAAPLSPATTTRTTMTTLTI